MECLFFNQILIETFKIHVIITVDFFLLKNLKNSFGLRRFAVVELVTKVRKQPKGCFFIQNIELNQNIGII